MIVKFMATAAAFACVIVFTPQLTKAKSWKGIVPLHSTRADVERLLGPANDEDYNIDGQQVELKYSAQGCQEGLPGGWKVPADTVVSISIKTNNGVSLADVLGSGKKYEQVYHVRTPEVVDYVDAQEGVRYATAEGSVQTVTYFASATDDQKLRCGEYKYAAPVPATAKNKFEQTPFDSYGKIPFEDAKNRIATFQQQLQDLNTGTARYQGFIIVYAGRSAHAGEAAAVVECTRNYLLGTLKVKPDSVVLTDGGYRDELTVDLYIMPVDAYPPMLMPTVGPKNVEILAGQATMCPTQ